MNVKRLAAVVAVPALAASLAACGGSTETAEPQPTTSASESNSEEAAPEPTDTEAAPSSEEATPEPTDTEVSASPEASETEPEIVGDDPNTFTPEFVDPELQSATLEMTVGEYVVLDNVGDDPLAITYESSDGEVAAVNQAVAYEDSVANGSLFAVSPGEAEVSVWLGEPETGELLNSFPVVVTAE